MSSAAADSNGSNQQRPAKAHNDRAIRRNGICPACEADGRGSAPFRRDYSQAAEQGAYQEDGEA
jgi:hypothetical protein